MKYVIQVENEMEFVTETPNKIKSSMKAATAMTCNANWDWKWNLRYK